MISPREEIVALHAVSGITLPRVAKLAGIPARGLRGYMCGIVELGIDETVALRRVLVDAIREQVTAEQQTAGVAPVGGEK